MARCTIPELARPADFVACRNRCGPVVARSMLPGSRLQMRAGRRCRENTARFAPKGASNRLHTSSATNPTVAMPQSRMNQSPTSRPKSRPAVIRDNMYASPITFWLSVDGRRKGSILCAKRAPWTVRPISPKDHDLDISSPAERPAPHAFECEYRGLGLGGRGRHGDARECGHHGRAGCA